MRRHDWPERLAAALEAARAQPFVWGHHDCVTFAADCALAMTDADPLAEWRGRWTSEAEAVALLADLGGLRGALTAALGAPLASPLLAQRGDVGVFGDPLQDGRELVAVVVAGGLAVPAARGLEMRPRARCDVAWRVN